MRFVSSYVALVYTMCDVGQLGCSLCHVRKLHALPNPLRCPHSSFMILLLFRDSINTAIHITDAVVLYVVAQFIVWKSAHLARLSLSERKGFHAMHLAGRSVEAFNGSQ